MFNLSVTDPIDISLSKHTENGNRGVFSMSSLFIGVYETSINKEIDNSLRFLNKSSDIKECSSWQYDTSEYASTIVSEVSYLITLRTISSLIS